MDEKTIQRIKKLQALAEQGVGGEKTTAQKKLAKLLKDNGINSLDELQKEEYEYTIFSYNGKIEYKEALTEIEAAAYELIPSNCISEMENIEARR